MGRKNHLSKKLWVDEITGRKKSFVEKIMRKNHGSKKIMGRKIYGSNKSWVEKIMGRKNHGLKKL